MAAQRAPQFSTQASLDTLATCVALGIGRETLQPRLREMKHHLRSKRYT